MFVCVCVRVKETQERATLASQKEKKRERERLFCGDFRRNEKWQTSKPQLLPLYLLYSGSMRPSTLASLPVAIEFFGRHQIFDYVFLIFNFSPSSPSPSRPNVVGAFSCHCSLVGSELRNKSSFDWNRHALKLVREKCTALYTKVH